MFTEPKEKNIRGIGLPRFRKDHQEALFLRFGIAEGARRLVGRLAPCVASLWEVKRFNEVFSETNSRVPGGQEGVVEAAWVGLGIPARGHRALGVSLDELGATTGAESFKEGMAKRSGEGIGDRRDDQRANWPDAFKPGVGVGAVLVVAADCASRLDAEVDQLCSEIHDAGVEIVFQERGDTLPAPLTGHEHFGFKDGVSQPTVEGLDQAPSEHEPPALPAGEFVLGCPSTATPSPVSGDLWTGGSYGVFRRLRQDVAKFRAQAQGMTSPSPTAGQATSPAPPATELDAKIVGRWPSGAPTDVNPESDPGEAGISNAFDFAADAEGESTPRFAHVRKLNPRNEEREDRSQEPAQAHRMTRAGMPYGDPLPAGTADDGADRGLHFITVVSDLDRQFEFVQRSWANNPNFPNGRRPGPNSPYGPPAPRIPADGVDPIIGAHGKGDLIALHQPGGIHELPLLAETVRVTAGEYFLLPSVHALQRVAEGATASTTTQEASRSAAAFDFREHRSNTIH